MDFLKSYRSLELDKEEAVPILSQLKSDTHLLSSVKLFDYSIVLLMVVTPLIQQEDVHLAKISGSEECIRFYYAKRQVTKENPCVITVKIKKNIVDVKYSSSFYTLVFHIREQADVDAFRGFINKAKSAADRHKEPSVILGDNIKDLESLGINGMAEPKIRLDLHPQKKDIPEEKKKNLPELKKKKRKNL